MTALLLSSASNCCGIVARRSRRHGAISVLKGARRVLNSSVIAALPPLVAIVDDEAHLRETVSRALNRDGYRTIAYTDGIEAWQSFEASLPDLVILDIIMPRMDGLELCRRIRGVSQKVPVMFLTSRDEEFDRVLGSGAGRRRLPVQTLLAAGAYRARESAVSPQRRERGRDGAGAGGRRQCCGQVP